LTAGTVTFRRHSAASALLKSSGTPHLQHGCDGRHPRGRTRRLASGRSVTFGRARSRFAATQPPAHCSRAVGRYICNTAAMGGIPRESATAGQRSVRDVHAATIGLSEPALGSIGAKAFLA
ncbi:MAG: hypothetical protein KJ749_03245, partial [Planctomycetes bacterium]|nr:hypothetical protein [Planctomycetota bacterium]